MSKQKKTKPQFSRSPGKKRKPAGHTKPNGQWDLLDKTYKALVDYALLPTTVAQMVRNPEAVSKVDDKPLLASRTRALCSDCEEMTKKLIDIHSQHEGKKGEPKTPDDVMRCVDLHTQYVDWAETYESVVYPTFIAISEQLGKAVNVDVAESKPTDLPVFKQQETTDEQPAD